MEVRFWAQTDVGRQRDHNEDNFLVDKKLNLFIVADGMGGHAAGEVASAAAVHEIRKYVTERQGQIRAYKQDTDHRDSGTIARLLEGAVRYACSKIHQLAEANPARRGMGTTVDVFLVVGSRGFIAHVGDSRVYMLRQDNIHQMTQDHTLVNELIRRGRLRPDQALDSPFKNAVTRAVGVYPSVDVDTMDFDILAGDRFMLCSDGLSGYLDLQPEVLHKLMGMGDLKAATRKLIDFANESGGKDNITVLTVEAFPESAELAALLASELQTKIEALKGIPLIRYLTYLELVRLLNITVTKEHEAGEVIIREGDLGDRFFVLLEGQVRVIKGETPIADLDAGAHFGEMALVDAAPRSATIQALTPSKTLAIPRESFYQVLQDDPQLAVKMLWAFVQVLTVRLRLSSSELADRMTEQEMVDRMKPLFQEPAPRKVAQVLPRNEVPDPGVSRPGLSLAEDEIEEARIDSDLVAPDSTYEVLKQEAALGAQISEPAREQLAAAYLAPTLPSTPVAHHGPAEEPGSRARYGARSSGARPPAPPQQASPGRLPSSGSEPVLGGDPSELTTERDLLARQVRARRELAGPEDSSSVQDRSVRPARQSASTDEDDDDIDTSPGRMAPIPRQGGTPSAGQK